MTCFCWLTLNRSTSRGLTGRVKVKGHCGSLAGMKSRRCILFIDICACPQASLWSRPLHLIIFCRRQLAGLNALPCQTWHIWLVGWLLWCGTSYDVVLCWKLVEASAIHYLHAMIFYLSLSLSLHLPMKHTEKLPGDSVDLLDATITRSDAAADPRLDAIYVQI